MSAPKPLSLDTYLGWLDLVVAGQHRPRPRVPTDDELDRVLERLRALQGRPHPR